jgi:hypothetical protein
VNNAQMGCDEGFWKIVVSLQVQPLLSLAHKQAIPDLQVKTSEK